MLRYKLELRGVGGQAGEKGVGGSRQEGEDERKVIRGEVARIRLYEKAWLSTGEVERRRREGDRWKERWKRAEAQEREGKIRKARYNGICRTLQTYGRRPRYLGEGETAAEKKLIARCRCGNEEGVNKYWMEEEYKGFEACGKGRGEWKHWWEECEEMGWGKEEEKEDKDLKKALGENGEVLDGRIHNAKFTESSGGVARNIADALGKLSCNPIFISAIGEDDAGRLLCSQISHINAEHIHKPANASTAQCAVIFDANGECKFLVGDMDIHKLITPAMIKEKEHLIKNAPLLILDANPKIEAIGAALEMASRHNVPVFFEPTDVPISKKPFESNYWNAIKYISPNITELKYIAEALGITLPSHTDDIIWESSYIAEAVANYIENVIVTLGKNGLLIARRAGAREPLMNGCNRGSIQIRHYPSGKINNLVNVSGAGDCLVSGLISAMLQDCSEEICISVGIASAHASLYSASAVPRELFNMLHKSWQSPASYTVLK